MEHLQRQRQKIYSIDKHVFSLSKEKEPDLAMDILIFVYRYSFLNYIKLLL